MLTHYHYNDTELKQLLSTMTIIIDTREQDLTIKKYLDSKKIPNITQKLDVGDYSVLLPANPALGIVRDTYFSVFLERKNSLEELSNCFCNDRTRFENELIRGKDLHLTLMIENATGYEDITRHNYKTEFNPKSFIASLLSFKFRYNLDIQFVSKDFAGAFVAQHMYYYLRNKLK